MDILAIISVDFDVTDHIFFTCKILEKKKIGDTTGQCINYL